MTANLRIHPPGVPVHVIQRGHNRASCFVDRDDCRAYMHLLCEALARYDVALHAYVLMTNHVHLLVTPLKADALSAAVMSFSRKYVQHINRRHQRTGTLWDSRYKSSAIEDDTYLFACYRYIELNPVRAGMVDDPAHYEWSSYRSNALGEHSAILTPRAEYLALAATASERQRAYRDIVADALHDDALGALRLAITRGRPIRRSDALPSLAESTSV